MTLKQLAKRTKLSVSLLSEIERGLAQPSMSSLKKISQAMGFSLFNFGEDQNKGPSRQNRLSLQMGRYNGLNTYTKDIRVVRSGNRKKLVYPNLPAVFELVTPDLNRLIEISYVRFKPGFDSGPEPIADPPGEKCVFILSGCIETRMRGEVFLLSEGDSIYYPGDEPVSFRVIGESPCHSILVMTPPSF